MQVKCNPLGKLLQKKFLVIPIAFVPIFGLLCIGPIVSGTYFAIPIIAIGLLFFVVILLFSGVGSFELADGKLRYETSFSLKRWAGEKNGKTVRATLTVANLQKVELYQNELEKKFNMGRVAFIGKAEPSFLEEQDVLMEYAEKGYDVNWLKLPTKHEFSGIKNFDQFREEVNVQAKNAAVLYNDSYEAK